MDLVNSSQPYAVQLTSQSMQYDHLYYLQRDQKYKMDRGGLSASCDHGFYNHFFSGANLEDILHVKHQA